MSKVEAAIDGSSSQNFSKMPVELLEFPINLICSPYLDSKDKSNLASVSTTSLGRICEPSESFLNSSSSLQLSIGCLSSVSVSNASFYDLIKKFRPMEISSCALEGNLEGQHAGAESLMESLSLDDCGDAVAVWSRDDCSSSSKTHAPTNNFGGQVLSQSGSIQHESHSVDATTQVRFSKSESILRGTHSVDATIQKLAQSDSILCKKIHPTDAQPSKRDLQHRESDAPAKRPNPPSKRHILKWSTDEDKRLQEGVEMYKLPNWKKIAKHVGTRSNKMCSQRWHYTLRPEVRLMKKGKWTKEEDDKLRQILSKEDEKNERAWNRASEAMGFSRNSIQCRERWNNFLDPTLRLGPWSSEEDECLLRLHAKFGSKWKMFTTELIGRSPGRIRRRFTSLMKKQV